MSIPALVSRTPLLGAVLAVILAALPGAAPASAQTITGRVIEEGSGRTVSAAVVRLVGFTGDIEVQTLADAAGRFEITPTREGEFYLEGLRLGYVRGRSPLLRLGIDGRATVDLVLAPAPIGLEGLEVRVDRLERIRRELRFAGVSPEALGSRFITRADFEHLLPRADLGEVLKWTGAIPRLRILRSSALSFGSDDIGLCVHFARPRQGVAGQCALAVLNGVPVPGTRFEAVNPDDVEAMAILGSGEGFGLYGRRGGGGVIMIWTDPAGAEPARPDPSKPIVRGPTVPG